MGTLCGHANGCNPLKPIFPTMPGVPVVSMVPWFLILTEVVVMLVLHKVSVFVDGAGNPYRKATAAEAVAHDTAARGSVAGKPGFYLPVDLSELAVQAKAKENVASSDSAE